MKTKEVETKTNSKLKLKTSFKKIYSAFKLILFLTAIVLTYFISNTFIDYVNTMDVATIKRVFNLILAVIVVILYVKGGKKGE